jgi:hypothetical protein
LRGSLWLVNRMCGKKIAVLTLVAASADMRDLGAVFDHEEPLLHPTCDHAQQNMRDEGYEASPVLRFIVAGRARAFGSPGASHARLSPSDRSK